MPLFEVQGPDGKTYEVDAPDMNSVAEALGSPGYAFPDFGKMDKAIADKGRGVIDKLFGVTGDRYQLWPERAAREALGTPKELINAAKSAPPGSRELTEALVGPAAKTALLASPRPGRVASPAGLPSAPEILSAGRQGFKAVDESGALIDPGAVGRLAETWRIDLAKRGFTDKNAPETLSILDELAGGGPAGTVGMSPGNLHTVRETLGKAAQNFGNPREQAAASSAIRLLDEYLGNIPERDVLAGDPRASAKSLAEAIQNYAAGKKSEQITDSLEVADLRAAAANSGLNQGNRERQTLAGILASDKKSSGFRPDELVQMERVVRGTIPGNLSRRLANMLASGGGAGQAVMSTLAAAGGGVAGGIPGALAAGAGVPMAGALFRKGAEASTRRQARILDEMIRARSPLGRAAVENMPAISDMEKARAASLAKMLLLELQAQQAQ